jgi:hypothetical protein
MDDMKNIDGKFIESSWTYIRYVVDIAREPFLILDNELRVKTGNDAFYRLFLVSADETEGKLVYDLGNGQWNSPQLKKLLESILPKSTFFKDFEVEHEFPLIGKKVMMVNARIIYGQGDHQNPFIIMAIEDITKQRLMEEKIFKYAKELESKVLDRTKELEKRIIELEIINKSNIDKGVELIDLKNQIRDLQKKIKL